MHSIFVQVFCGRLVPTHALYICPIILWQVFHAILSMKDDENILCEEIIIDLA